MAKKKHIDVVKKLRAAWQEYQNHGVDKHGLDFGKKLFDLRAGSEVVQGGTTFKSSLDEAGIPRRTAYYWIHSYEISIGVREPDKPKDKQSEPDQTAKEPVQSAEPKPFCNIHGVPFKPTPRDIYWVPPANPPDIKGWSSMDAGEKHRAGQEAGCEYCLTYPSARSCPAHGWPEKRHDHGMPIIPFEPQRKMALQIINDGFKARSAEEPEKQRLIQSAKDWAHARLKSTDLSPANEPPELKRGFVFVHEGITYIVNSAQRSDDHANPDRLPMIEVSVEEHFEKHPVITKQATQGARAKKTERLRHIREPKSAASYCDVRFSKNNEATKRHPANCEKCLALQAKQPAPTATIIVRNGTVCDTDEKVSNASSGE